MSKSNRFQLDTLSLHAGQRPDATTGARATPIYQTASYAFRSPDHAASVFNIERPGHVDSLTSNPTNAVLEERISALDGGVGAIATASGQAALHLAIVTLMGAGSHILCSQSVNGGTHSLLAHTMPRFGVDTTFVDPRDINAFRAAIRPNTRLVFGEILSELGLEVLNISEVAKVAHEAGLPLLVDSTFTTPYLCRPLDLGADLVHHSATQFLGGHGVAVGGLLVDGGIFDWEASGKFPTLTEPYEGFHNLDFVEQFGPAAFITRARWEGLRDFGACMSANTAFLILQGLETLPLRMAKHVDNARILAHYLNEHDAVECVNFPDLPDHPDFSLARELLPRGCGAVFSFVVEGGRAAAQRFIERLELFSHLASTGDAKSLVIHPASTTHHRMDAQALEAAGLSEGLVRMSVGIEDPDDLIADIDRGLRAAQKV